MIRRIVAIDSNRGIAKDGVQPWKLPTDEAYFGEMTKQYGGAILMGRKTFDVIGHALPDRQNFVASRHSIDATDVKTVADVQQFLRDCEGDIWVIGGAHLYELTMPMADELYITEITADFDCDQFYPAVPAGFTLTADSGLQTENNLSFSFRIYANYKK